MGRNGEFGLPYFGGGPRSICRGRKARILSLFSEEISSVARIFLDVKSVYFSLREDESSCSYWSL